MQKIAIITAETIQKGMIAGAKNIEKNKEQINELNVFPVPDGDTGTNMFMTAQSAADAVSSINTNDMQLMCKTISQGALRGARGNSGVILSQLLRGFAKSISDTNKQEVGIPELKNACEKATETAFKAVMKPKEGTILTVARSISEKALSLDDSLDITSFVRELIKEGKKALENTPNQLHVLKEAGVVDSGGQGLICLLEGIYSYIVGEEYVPDVVIAKTPKITKIDKKDISTADIEFKYCTEFIIMLPDDKNTDKISEEIREYLSSIGNSLVVVGDDDIIKIHVHTNHPGLAFEKGCEYGSLTKMKIDNMEEEHKETLELEEQPAINKEIGFIAISAGEGISDIFKEFGVDEIISGGQTMNPSAEDIISAIEKVPANNVFIFPNNKNIILAASQAADIVENKNVIVIPTKTIPEGISCMVNYMEGLSCEELTQIFNDAILTVTTLEITTATRDVNINNVEVKENDYIGISSENGIITSNKKLKTSVIKSIEKTINDDISMITLYSGKIIDKATTESIINTLTELYPDIEFDACEGKQPVYHYIISLE